MKNRVQNPDTQDSVIHQDMTVGELVVQYPQMRLHLEKMGIDYCCGGKLPLSAAAKQAGVEWPILRAALKDVLTSEPKGRDNTDWNSVSLSVLVDHIVDTHHAFLKEQLPRLDQLGARVEKAHAAEHGEMLSHLRRVYGLLRNELEPHLMKEEQILFPTIKGIDAFMTGTGPRPVVHCGSVANPIAQMEHEHDTAGSALVDLRQVTANYQLPPDACQSFAALYDGLQALEADLHEHIHLENNILFPKSIAQEHEMR